MTVGVMIIIDDNTVVSKWSKIIINIKRVHAYDMVVHLNLACSIFQNVRS